MRSIPLGCCGTTIGPPPRALRLASSTKDPTCMPRGPLQERSPPHQLAFINAAHTESTLWHNAKSLPQAASNLVMFGNGRLSTRPGPDVSLFHAVRTRRVQKLPEILLWLVISTEFAVCSSWVEAILFSSPVLLGRPRGFHRWGVPPLFSFF